MTQSDDLETRMTALETEVRELAGRVRNSEQDAAAARVLAGGADRDVEQFRGEIRDFRKATMASFNAMREDLTHLRQRMDSLETRLEVKIDTGFTEMRGRLDTTAADMQHIADLLNTLIAHSG